MYAFNAADYEVLYQQTEIAVLTLKRPYLINPRANGWSMDSEIPPYVFLFREEIIPELFNNPMLGVEGCNLTQLVASAYKEMFYQHFQRGEVWKGRALERALSMMFLSITGQSLYDKCNATHWIFKTAPHSRAAGDVELNTVLEPVFTKGGIWPSSHGTRFIKGDTPTNGKQTSTLAVAELTINSKFIWASRENSNSIFPLEKLVIATASPHTKKPIPTFGEIILANADKIRQFVKQ